MANASNTSSMELASVYCSSSYQTAWEVHAVTFPLWCLALGYWAHEVLVARRENSLELHRSLLGLPGIEVAVGASSIAYRWACPSSRLLEQLSSSAWLISTIIKAPLLALNFLLIANGWCITRRRLPHREMSTLVALTTALYASTIVDAAFSAPASLALLLAAWAAVVLSTLRRTVSSLRVLRVQLCALRRFGMDVRSTPAHAKYRIIKAFLRATLSYYAADVALFYLSRARVLSPIVLAAGQQAAELSVVLVIGAYFRPRPAVELDERNQQLADEMAEQIADENVRAERCIPPEHVYMRQPRRGRTRRP